MAILPQMPHPQRDDKPAGDFVRYHLSHDLRPATVAGVDESWSTPMLRRVVTTLVRWFPLRRQARLIARVLPARLWYRWALALSRLQGRLTGWTGGNRPLTEAVMLDNWLRELTLVGPFPIPCRAVETKALERQDRKVGLLYCWTHVPLVELPLRALLELGFEAPLMVAHPGKIVGNSEFVVPGLRERVIAAPANRNVLAKIKTVLQGGGTVACLADADLSGQLSSQVLRIAGKVGARVIFQWARRLEDGTIQVWFVDAPHPFCNSEDAIQQNLEFLRGAKRDVLALLGVSFDESAMPGRDATLKQRVNLTRIA